MKDNFTIGQIVRKQEYIATEHRVRIATGVVVSVQDAFHCVMDCDGEMIPVTTMGDTYIFPQPEWHSLEQGIVCVDVPYYLGDQMIITSASGRDYKTYAIGTVTHIHRDGGAWVTQGANLWSIDVTGASFAFQIVNDRPLVHGYFDGVFAEVAA